MGGSVVCVVVGVGCQPLFNDNSSWRGHPRGLGGSSLKTGYRRCIEICIRMPLACLLMITVGVGIVNCCLCQGRAIKSAMTEGGKGHPTPQCHDGAE